MAIRKVVVKQEEESPIAVEVLARSIVDMEKGVRRIQQSGLSNRAIALLLRDCMSGNHNLAEIIQVLDYLPKLANVYIHKK